jgi:hypothetical protein
MKKISFLFLSIIFGYIALMGVALNVNPSAKDVPIAMSIIFIVVGFLGTRFFWKKFRLPKVEIEKL